MRTAHVLAFVAAALQISGVSEARQARTPSSADVSTASLPLVPTRSLRFSTDEVTWMSVDVSPDGRTIVFDLLGDLYSLPIDGGKATRLTSGQEFDSQPRYSPDGRLIAFVSDRDGAENIWAVTSDGSAMRRITHAVGPAHMVSPEWTLDGTSVAVSRYRTSPIARDQAAVYLVDVATGSMTEVPGTHGTMSLGAAFGADPQSLYLAYCAWPGFGSTTVETFDLKTGERVARAARHGGAIRPVISPDGRYLVYGTRLVTETALILKMLLTGDERILVNDAQPMQDERNDPTLDWLPGSSFTPDGTALITSSRGKLWRVAIPSGERTEIRFTAEVDQMLGPLNRFEYPYNDGRVTARRVRTARLSPDGRHVAFVALDHLYVQSLPSGKPRRVTTFNAVEHSPVWSPDGEFLSFLTWDDQKGGHVYRVPTSGACGLFSHTGGSDPCAPERLSDQAAYYDKLNFSPDGLRLVMIRGDRYPQVVRTYMPPYPLVLDVVWLPANGGSTTRIGTVRASTMGATGTPHFRNGDDSHVYIADLAGLDAPAADGLTSMSLTSLRLDGSDRRTVLTIKDNWSVRRDFETDILLSPDGAHALVASYNQVYVTALPLQQSTPPVITLRALQSGESRTQRVSPIGGVFPWWSEDGRGFSYSLGSALFTQQLGGQSHRVDLNVTVAKDKPEGAVAFRGARIVTERGDEVIERGDLVIRDNRIAAIGPQGNVRIPSNARSVDVSGKTIIPGLIDIHYHVSGELGVHRRQVWGYLANLAYGVTTVHDPSAPSDTLDYMDRIEAGDVLGPRVFTTGMPIMEEMATGSLDEMRMLLRAYSEFYHTNTVKQYVVGNRQQRQWLNMAAREQRLTATTEGGGDFKSSLTHVLDGYSGKEHLFPIFPLSNDVIALISRSGTVNTPTLMLFAEPYFMQHEEPRRESRLRRFTPADWLNFRTLRSASPWMQDSQYQFVQYARDLAKIVRAGGMVGLGAHGQLPGLGTHWELWAMGTGGLSPRELLRIGTINGATAIGMGLHLGSLEPGKLADLLVLDTNPLDDIRNTAALRYVMKNGRLYEAETLNEIWPLREQLEPQYWWAYETEPE